MEKKLLNLLDTCALGECCKAENCTNDICNGYDWFTKKFDNICTCYVNKEDLEEHDVK